MLPNLPREVFWKDRKSMDEMLESPLFKVLYEAFPYFEREPMLFKMDELTILNEVGYQVTRLCYESRFTPGPNIEQFTRDVFAHTGLKDHAMTVISLVYAVIKLVDFPPLNISKKTMRELSKLNRESWCYWYIESYIKRVKRDGYCFNEQFLPYQEDSIPAMKDETCGDESTECAETSRTEQQDRTRRFTLDEIVNYAKENLTANNSHFIQNMLYNLLVEDGTKEEREKVASILPYVIKRDHLEIKEYVHQKIVENEFHNVAADGIGVNKEYH